MMVELSQRNNDDTMKKANLFLSQLKQIPKKYTEQQSKQFIAQYHELDDHQRYTCVQIILSNAWGHINADKRNKARADLGFILPLCVEKGKKQLYYPDFQVDRMLWQSWVNDQSFNQKTKQENNTLLIQCGFKFQPYTKPQPKKKKSGFQAFLDNLRCRCCAKSG